MYSTCIFCLGSLGRNEALESFQVGRRLAYDPERGRLWVVCLRCERWNLTPLESRWEAIEEAERSYRQTRLRTASENIGLARLKEGLELVRIGVPPRLELAGWRYGGALAYVLFDIRKLRRDTRTPTVFLTREDGTVMALTKRDTWTAQLATGLSMQDWSLRVGYQPRVSVLAPKLERPSAGPEIFRGRIACRALVELLPHTNPTGGTARSVRDAVAVIESQGTFEELIHAAAASRKTGNNRSRASALTRLPRRFSLALEMALHENDERRATEGDLVELEQRWRNAEEIASIADRLLIPDEIDARLTGLRKQTQSPHT